MNTKYLISERERDVGENAFEIESKRRKGKGRIKNKNEKHLCFSLLEGSVFGVEIVVGNQTKISENESENSQVDDRSRRRRKVIEITLDSDDIINEYYIFSQTREQF